MSCAVDKLVAHVRWEQRRVSRDVGTFRTGALFRCQAQRSRLEPGEQEGEREGSRKRKRAIMFGKGSGRSDGRWRRLEES